MRLTAALRTTLHTSLRKLASEQDCYLCGCASVQAICMECVAVFPAPPPHACPRCALPVPQAGVCGRCIADPPHFDATVAAFAYGEPLDQALQAFKYRHALGLTHFLAAQLDRALDVAQAAARDARLPAALASHGGAAVVACAASPVIDLIVPMPLAPARLADRGFNQALELARPIAQRRRIAVDAQMVHRIRDTPPQALLPWKERARNIQGAFACTGAAGSVKPHPLAGLRIAVVDDVMTTGSTLNELARVLKAAGAAHVSNWVAARTLPHSFSQTAAPASA